MKGTNNMVGSYAVVSCFSKNRSEPGESEHKGASSS